MSEYTLSVVIPCWNCEDYISQMLECIINQSFQDWRTYCIDDQSTDGTAAVIKKYTVRDSRIQYVRRERMPKGAQTCRNIGVGLSKGAEFIIFFDGDDLIAPYCFEQRVNYLQQKTDLDMAVFPAKAFHKDIFDGANYVYGKEFGDKTILSMLNWNLPLVVCTNIYRYEAVIKYALEWDENVLSLQDSDFNIQSICKGLNYEFAQNACFDYFYRIGQNGVSKKIRTEAHYQSHVYLINKIQQSVSSAFGNKYDFYLKANVLNFFNVFGSQNKYYYMLLRLPWMKKHKLFNLQLLLYVLSGRHGKKMLFGKYLNYSRSLNAKWLDFMKCEADAFRNSNVIELQFLNK